MSERITSPRINKSAADKDVKQLLAYFEDQVVVHTGPPLEDFPNNIKRWIWSSFTEDYTQANLLCELTNGLSVLYTARGCFCCYRGFGDKADVTTTSASTTAALVLSISDRTYADYIEGTVAADADGCPLNPEELYGKN
jgi:hypothetical protein